MLRRLLLSASALALPLTVSLPAAAQEAETAVDERWIWDLTALYESPEAWEAAHDEVAAEIETLRALKGTLGDGADDMADAYDAVYDVYKELMRLVVYATLKADEDTRIAVNEARRQKASLLSASFSQAISWMSPELLSIGERKIDRFLGREDRLDPYAFDIQDTLRMAPHTLDADGEQIMAATSTVRGAPGAARNTFFNGEVPWPTIELDGEEVTLSPSLYGLYRQDPDRGDRKAVFEAFFGKIGEFEATFGQLLSGHLQGLKVSTTQRGYESSVQRALFEDAMPAGVYDTLISEVNEALPTLHRYFELRKRMLGIEDDLRYWDIYPSLVELDKEFTIEESIELTRQALAPLGPEYLGYYDEGVAARWMHVYPQPGKRSGAYMFGSAYDVHPYVLLNHNDDFDSASTFAHEYGHAVHTQLSKSEQPFPTFGYATFIAETASIMNEMLLSDLMIENAQTPEEKLFYLGEALESARGTYFRQAMFGEFEKAVNDRVDAGEALTGEDMTVIYTDLLKRYHGHDDGVLVIDDLVGVEWAYIPHFYYDFYVYQYATSIAAASYLAEQIGDGDMEARDRFITLLKAGGSDHAYELMKEAGIDLATPAAYEALERRMNDIMDQMEAILAEEGQ